MSDVTERLTLLALVCLADQGETPAHAEKVSATCRTQLVDASVDPTDKAVVRRLKRLADTEYVDQTRIDDQSPVGKGNPAYRLAVDVETALEPFVTERQIAKVVESIESDGS
ncbi:hypothetical protein [Natranaeroarchaeum sulfidigenes]|uniref:Orc1/cdc6 family replication initiation protein n=1 Tax=Natranaeroarchaeum sulfidigenes TaxID=2784880 RepID=A0A897MZ10_9EURY|nr:hypothetical protein [Natranaeroarchaeum sulfidigenes]QSG04323.1 Orc1/cdc6 family replication initiation protein [Natranaeroarchaeum sulfidigenes]